MKILQVKVREEHVVNEMKLTIYVAAHSSTMSVDHIGELLPIFEPKSSALVKMQLHRTKCAHLHKYVLGPAFKRELCADVGDSFYSLVMDESTNVANDQCMGINIRHYRRQQHKIVDTMY